MVVCCVQNLNEDLILTIHLTDHFPWHVILVFQRQSLVWYSNGGLLFGIPMAVSCLVFQWQSLVWYSNGGLLFGTPMAVSCLVFQWQSLVWYSNGSLSFGIPMAVSCLVSVHKMKSSPATHHQSTNSPNPTISSSGTLFCLRIWLTSSVSCCRSLHMEDCSPASFVR